MRKDYFLKCFLFLYLITKTFGLYENQPKMITYGGNLAITPGKNKNITIRLHGNSKFKINDFDVTSFLTETYKNHKTSKAIYFEDPWNNFGLQSEVNGLKEKISGPKGIDIRLRFLENSTRLAIRNTHIRLALRRVIRLEGRVNRILEILRQDNCRSNPCQNGGTCIDIYDSFMCRCLSNWEGTTCGQDVNECANFAGTDLGCQNGAECINLQGSYSCSCSMGWVGVHCTKRKIDCLTSASSEICVHGTCINAKENFGYTCICEQGWKSNGISPACDVDVDECASLLIPCATTCINLPGSYTCGPCSTGFTGNGHSCIDINECAVDNGGCSTNPLVKCLNTYGSYHCGDCPLGWSGNGRLCTKNEGNACSFANICHPAAICREISNTVVCTCPTEMLGTGIGPDGCYLKQNGVCNSTTCMNGGTCIANGTNFFCKCTSGFLPPNCQKLDDPCNPSPCKNGGTCLINSDSRCLCAPNFTGIHCEKQRPHCGSIFRTTSGTLKYPQTSRYENNARCIWLIRTNITKVLNITFTKFDLEPNSACIFDFLQIHDGSSTAAQLIGRFCGSKLPKGGIFQTSHNTLYMWFKSDNATNGEGFELHWNATEPTCGGTFDIKSFGQISSPGSPGKYPPNRDCLWNLKAPYGKRIQLTFFRMQIEAHETCNNDYLEIYNGINMKDNQLAKFCNITYPPPLTSSGNEVSLHFHSDSDGNDGGFQIHYNVIEGFPGCGGLYTSNTGEILSPTKDGKYLNNLICEYLIILPKGSQISLSFLFFDLEQSEECLYDSLEIFEGSTEDDPKVNAWCGNTKPDDYTSISNTLLIKFKTDHSHNSQGFRIKYDVACGGVYENTPGIITSPFYPNSYPVDRICKYNIHAPLGFVIQLDFMDLDLEEGLEDECHYDILKIIDELNKTKPSFYCGKRIPERIISQSNLITIELHSDVSVTGRGFKANYSFIQIGCGGVIRRDHIFISPPLESSEDVYKKDTMCEWLIMAPSGSVIQLSWLNFHLEDSSDCSYDFVDVFDSSDDKTNKIGRFCGKNIPPSFTSSTNAVTIKFRSDESESKSGFTATFIFIDAHQVCGGNLFAEFGVIRSPLWPKDYPMQIECIWTITSKKGRQIELNVKSFNLEKHDNCAFDYLEIRNGAYSDSPLIGKFCSNIPKWIPSFANQLYVKFHSDGSSTYPGFDIEWDSTSIGCGGDLTTHRGSITSPNYPLAYGHNAQCNWQIIVSQGASIFITIHVLQLEDSYSCYDSLEIFDGLDTSKKPLVRYCASSLHPLVVMTSSNKATIRFTTDDSNSKEGFKLSYAINCNRMLNGFQGVIESPNFPNSYPNDIKCEWRIKAKLGNHIALIFSHFDIEENALIEAANNYCNFDYVEIEDINANETLSKRRYCKGPLVPFNSLGNEVVIRFVSDITDFASGFRLEYTRLGCGGVLSKSEGKLQYPDDFQEKLAEIECEWIIKVEAGKSIELEVLHLNSVLTLSCSYEKLLIANGVDDTHILSTFCGDKKQQTYIVTSTGNLMYVYYQLKEISLNRGFHAQYKTVPSKCGGRISAIEGNLVSPNYPQNYESNSTCEWLLQTNELYTLNITFLDLDIEESVNCSKDYLEIYDGNMQEADLLLIKICGNSSPNITSLTSRKSEVLLVFVTDNDNEYKGFKLSFNQNCGKNIYTSGRGVIKLEDQQLRFTKCVWRIKTNNTAEGRITVTTYRFRPMMSYILDLPPFGNGISFFDGDSVNAPLKFKTTSEHPPQIISYGNAITIQIFPEYIAEFEARYSIFENECGGDLSFVEGVFSSPYYPDPYKNNIECFWNILPKNGHSIELNIKKLDIESSENCNSNYLEIRQTGPNGNLLGLFCGTNPPPQMKIQGKVWVKFHSDESSTAQGFLAEYKYAHLTELSGLLGFIESAPMRMFERIQDTYQWRISAPLNKIIVVKFEKNKYDNEIFEAYDGYDETAQKISVPLEQKGTFFSSTSTIFLTIRLTYFKLDWRVTERKVQIENVTDNNCEYKTITIGNLPITLNSPGYPNGYGENLKCHWIVKTNMSDTSVLLRLLVVDLSDDFDCYSDYLIISKSSDLVTWNDEKKFCKLDSKNYYKGTPYLQLEFVTDYAINRTGFASIILPVCGSNMRSSQGVIHGTKFLTYNSDNECIWTIKVRKGQKIKLEFEIFNISTKQEGICDNYVVIKNGMDVDSPALGIGRYCGTKIPELPLTNYNQAFIKYSFLKKTDVWSLKYSEIGDECDWKLTLSRENNQTMIMSPNYPNMANPHTECVWTIIGPKEKHIQIDFIERFDLTSDEFCRKEYVAVWDGATELSPLIGKFCKTHPDTIYSTDNVLRIKYFNDISEPKTGFKSIAKIRKCGGTFRANKGLITSTYYPSLGGYPRNSVCEYKILQPSGTNIFLQFEDIHLPEASNCSLVDHISVVSILRKYNDTQKYQETPDVCGSNHISFLSTSSNEVSLIFNSYASNMLYRGFKISYNVSRQICGGTIEADTGVLQSPGYPHLIIGYRLCVWKIKVPKRSRVKMEILDYDLPNINNFTINSLFGSYQGVRFYNDYKRMSLITTIGSNHQKFIYSTDNIMVVTAWIVRNSIGRGFQMRFSSEEPTICVGDINEPYGIIKPPKTNQTYFCQYDAEVSTNQTFAIIFADVIMKLPPSESVCDALAPLRVIADESLLICAICRNITSKTIALPYSKVNLLIVYQRYIGDLFYNIHYKRHNCGGNLLLSNDINITMPNFSKNYGPLACVWLLLSESEDDFDHFAVRGFVDFKLDCVQEYLILRNGPTHPKLGLFCNQQEFSNITVSKEAYLEYYSTDYHYSSKFQIEFENNRQCGGYLKNSFININFNRGYRNNIECIWIIETNIGYRIGIEFFGRFFIEDSYNCTKDYLLIEDNINDSWREIDRVCGRKIPSNYNSTGKKMRLIFRSNNSTTGDGFSIHLLNVCGGIFRVLSKPQDIYSPNYPQVYDKGLNCNYTFITSETQMISIKFLDFQIENTSKCSYDNITIYSEVNAKFNMGTFCQEGSLEKLLYKQQVSLIFKSDFDIQKKGFHFQYELSKCGGHILSNTFITSPIQTSKSGPTVSIDCIWNITAPVKNKIVILFKKLDLPLTFKCMYAYVDIFSGKELKENKRKARFCGNFTENIPTITINENHAIINQKIITWLSNAIFSALVALMPFCDQDVTLTYDANFYDFIAFSNGYNNSLDCTYVFTAPIGSQIQIKFQQFDLAPCTVNTTDKCSCDFLEIRDGKGPFSEIIDRYCGHEIPPTILSTKSNILVRFVSDSSIKSTGFRANISVIASDCGPTSLTLSGAKDLVIKSPGNFKYPPNCLCLWRITSNESFYIHFEKLDIQEADPDGICRSDSLEIFNADSPGANDFLEESTIFISQRDKILPYLGISNFKHVYCGIELPSEYYTKSDHVFIKFRSDAEVQKSGFKITIKTFKDCNRNYTGSQGKVMFESKENCVIFITAPNNYTLSLYFTYTYTYGQPCEYQNLKILDANSQQLIKTICNDLEPSKSLFSNTNALQLNFQHRVEIAYDFTFLATNNGPGCGGILYNIDGIFTSPYYPSNERNYSDCRWEVIVPSNLKCSIRFQVFDLGSKVTCLSDFLEIIERNPGSGQEEVVRRYCGEDNPADFYARTNILKIRYKKSVHFDGIGWVIYFNGIHSDSTS